MENHQPSKKVFTKGRKPSALNRSPSTLVVNKKKEENLPPKEPRPMENIRR